MGIGEKFLIRSDKMNFILDKIAEVVDKETKEIKNQPKEIGCYWKFENSLERCLQEIIRDSESTSIEELINEIKEFKRCVVEIVKRENITLKALQDESV